MIELLLVPYDAAGRSVGMGRGPGHLVESGVAEHLVARGHEVHVHTIESTIGVPGEIQLAVDLACRLAERVRASRLRGRFPLILAGRCMSSLGVVAGLESQRTGVVWFDSHGDFNTPETSRSGMLDGMAGAVIAGSCWSGVAATVPGFVPVSESRYVLVGARDLDPGEAELLGTSEVVLVGRAQLQDGGARRVADIVGDGAAPVYIHVDLDVLDPDTVGRANQYAAPGGLEATDVAEVVRAIGARFELGAATLSAYDPSFDAEGGVLEAALEIATVVVGSAAARTP